MAMTLGAEPQSCGQERGFMNSPVHILVVFLIAVGAFVLLYWYRRRRFPRGTAYTNRESDHSEDVAPVDSTKDAAKTIYEEKAKEQFHEIEAADHCNGELELRAKSTREERRRLDSIGKKKGIGGDLQLDDTGAVSNTGWSRDADTRPTVNEPSAGSCVNNLAPVVSARDKQFTQTSQSPTGGENEKHYTDSAELRVGHKPLAATAPAATRSEPETSADEKAKEGIFSDALESEAAVDHSDKTPRATRRQARIESGQKPRRYEGLRRRQPRLSSINRDELRGAVGDRSAQERSLPIEVRLRFDRGGSCVVSLIPSRSPGGPEVATVAADSGQFDLRAMQNEWYQDVTPEDTGRVLYEGALWAQEGGTGVWSLRGRDLYVLGERSNLSGWVSQPHLKLGRKHVILCTEQFRPVAEQALREAGVDSSIALETSFGSPSGWAVIRDVVPTRPVSPSDRADALNALRPLPDLEICFEGGVRLEYSAWLDGYPPLIRVYGDPVHTPEVRIDGCIAFCGKDGAFQSPTWDATGKHTVWCAGISKSYSIVPFEASWELWEAHSFPVVPGSSRRVSICGPMVREAGGVQQDWTATIEVPETNTVILGAVPGEHTIAVRASNIRGMPCLASPSFRAVWALPPDAMHCNKQTTRILFLDEYLQAAPNLAGNPSEYRYPSVNTWAKLILDASRKRIGIQPDTERARALWRRYRRVAHGIWRSRK